MRIRTVKELRDFLSDSGKSPERFAQEVKISNMTLRRLLKKSAATKIPEKYHAALDLPFLAAGGAAVGPGIDESALRQLQDLDGLMADLEAEGRRARDLPKLESDLKEKLKANHLGRQLKDSVLSIVRGIRSDHVPTATKAVCIGALIYFINPFDIIPDALPGIGYLDDMVALSIAWGCLTDAGRSASKAGGRRGSKSNLAR